MTVTRPPLTRQKSRAELRKSAAVAGPAGWLVWLPRLAAGAQPPARQIRGAYQIETRNGCSAGSAGPTTRCTVALSGTIRVTTERGVALSDRARPARHALNFLIKSASAATFSSETAL